MSTIHIFSALLFLASAVLLIAAERFKEDYEGLSRKLAIGSLVAVFGAGVLFVMDVPQIGGLMDPWEKTKVVKKKGGGGGSADDEEEEEAEQKSDGGGGGGGKRRVTAAEATSHAGGGGKKAQAATKTDAADADADGDSKGVTDCEGCPKFVDIAPGSAMIGAEPTEPLATNAERPGRKVTIWPGFAIAQRPITVAQYKRFAEATGRSFRQCARDEATPLLKPGNPESTPATCITYDDASAYASWLSSRTGKVYRLPTAAQWEFVARGATDPTEKKSEKPLVHDVGKSSDSGWPVVGMKIGVAELVLDCWSDKLEVIQDGATGRNKANCAARVLKGAARGEQPRWQYPWARRPIPVASHSVDVGFRIVRMN